MHSITISLPPIVFQHSNFPQIALTAILKSNNQKNTSIKVPNLISFDFTPQDDIYFINFIITVNKTVIAHTEYPVVFSCSAEQLNPMIPHRKQYTVFPRFTYNVTPLGVQYQQMQEGGGGGGHKKLSSGSSSMNCIFDYDNTQFGDEIFISSTSKSPATHQYNHRILDKLQCMQRGDKCLWWYAQDYLAVPQPNSMYILHKDSSENYTKISFMYVVPLLQDVKNRTLPIRGSDNIKSNHLLQEMKCYEFCLHGGYSNINDAAVWSGVQYFSNSQRALSGQLDKFKYPLDILPDIINIDPFKPKQCSRKLFLVTTKNGRYIYSPMISSTQKWTPIYEIYNFQLAVLMNYPQEYFNIPHVFEAYLGPAYGVGSCKLYIENITKRGMKYNHVSGKNREAFIWLKLYDYYIGNVEREWNDHLSMDSNSKFILLDNDSIVLSNSSKQLKPPGEDVINSHEGRKIVQRMQTLLPSVEACRKYFPTAPLHWIESVQSRINKLLY